MNTKSLKIIFIGFILFYALYFEYNYAQSENNFEPGINVKNGKNIHEISEKNTLSMKKSLKTISNLSCNSLICQKIKLEKLNILIKKIDKKLSELTEYDDHYNIFAESQKKWGEWLENAAKIHSIIYSSGKESGQNEYNFRILMTEERISSLITYYSDYAEELAFKKGHLKEE